MPTGRSRFLDLVGLGADAYPPCSPAPLPSPQSRGTINLLHPDPKKEKLLHKKKRLVQVRWPLQGAMAMGGDRKAAVRWRCCDVGASVHARGVAG